MILVIDNYDSFTYNLVQYFEQLGYKTLVYKHDKITIALIKKLKPSFIVLSPGPKAPLDAGISLEVIHNFYKKTPILGVCLGHQCIAYYFGASVVKAQEIVHGKASLINHSGKRLFRNIHNPCLVGRYHSLKISNCPENFYIDANYKNIIMAIAHKELPVFGVQFHPESILSDCGFAILKNFFTQGD